MIIDNAMIPSLALGQDRAVPELGDGQLKVLPILSPVERLLIEHHLADPIEPLDSLRTSGFASFSRTRLAATAATADRVVTLVRGLWTVSFVLSGRFSFSVLTGAVPEINLVMQLEADTRNLAVLYSQINPSGCNVIGKFRCLIREEATIRLDMVATAAAQVMDATVCLQIERNL